MSFSATRLTLHVILSSIEEDLRSLIITDLAIQKSSLDLLGNELLITCQTRLSKDTGSTIVDESLSRLILYTDFGDLFKILNSNSDLLSPNVARYLKSITKDLEKLVPIRNRVAHTRPLNFDDLPITLDVAQDLQNSSDIKWTALSSTLAHLRNEPSFVLGLKIPTYEENDRNYRHNLPTSDFDETGFLGRKKEVSDIVKACQGVYPVISIVAEGGIGKTALALKVAYDLLDAPDCPFEAIVWHSSKTAMLTPNEIKRVGGAIDSLGVFRSVAQHLAGHSNNDPLDEIIAYLEEFRILLILDNLETILDERIRSFLGRLGNVSKGSKILITSRLSVGAFDYPYKLRPMESGDATQLLRALAKTRNVRFLLQMPNQQLSAYCDQMKNNPGWIKWFVSAVQAGARPEEVLANPDIFLEFCMENVSNHLSMEGLRILQSMLVVPGQLSQAELAYINVTEDEAYSLDIQKSLLELLTTNMVVMASATTGSSFSSHYELSALARDYLSKHLVVKTQDYQHFTKRHRQLIAIEEQSKARLDTSILSIYSFATQTRSEVIVAEYLRKALYEAERKNYENAETRISEANQLAPGYFEVKRTEAMVKDLQGNISSALSAYQAAVDIEPGSVSLRYWFGIFIVRRLGDAQAALIQFEEAAKIDPSHVEVHVQIARMNLFLANFDQAENMIKELFARTDLTKRSRFKLYDLNLQLFYRRADQLLSHDNDHIGTLDHLEMMQQAYSAYPDEFIDRGMRQTLEKALSLVGSLAVSHDLQVSHRANQLVEWLRVELSTRTRGSKSLAAFRLGDRLQGTVTKTPAKGYTFVRSKGENIFLHARECRDHHQWARISIGDKVEFTLQREEKGYRAYDVVLLKASDVIEE